MTCIYVMTVGEDLIKIGYAHDPVKRLRDLRRQVGKPMVIYAAFDCRNQDHRQIERAIHVALKDRCIYREVFSMTPREALPYIAAAFGLSGRALARRLWIQTEPEPEPEAEEPTIDGHICRVVRKINRWTVKELAQRSGAQPNTILRYEKGIVQPRKARVLAIQRVLETGTVKWWREGGSYGFLGDDW